MPTMVAMGLSMDLEITDSEISSIKAKVKFSGRYTILWIIYTC